VVGLSGVAEVVQQDVVDECQREQQEPGVQGDHANTGAAPPAAPGEADCAPGVREAAPVAHRRQPGREMDLALPEQPAPERPAARGRVWDGAGDNEPVRINLEHTNTTGGRGLRRDCPARADGG